MSNFKEQLKLKGINNLYYFARLENLKSILLRGILSHNDVQSNRVSHLVFSDERVQKLRAQKSIYLSNSKCVNLHELVPLYLKTRTPTLYAVKHLQEQLFFIEINLDVLSDPGVGIAFCDGNAASNTTKCFNRTEQLDQLPWQVINSNRWDLLDYPDGKRQCNSEFLIYPKVETRFFQKIIVYNMAVADAVKNIVFSAYPITVESEYFFSDL